MTSSSSETLCKAYGRFLRALAVLALPAQFQRVWLNDDLLGEAGLCDELADDYYQHWLILGKFVEAGLINERSVGPLDDLSGLLGSIINPHSDLGLIEALDSSPRWDDVRELAARCILTLK